MRIITGRARGTKLYTLDGETTRPTSERVKEAVFSMIQFSIEGREVLDLFGGSGQLALEAISRGAAHATVVDSSKDAANIIKKNIEKTHSEADCILICADHVEALRRLRGRQFDLVFLDPPYNRGLVADSLARLFKYGMLKPTSIVICESGGEDILASDAADCYEVIKSVRYGVANITLLKLKGEGEK